MKAHFSIDPLSAKQAVTDEVAQNALKREISNILDSYVGWFDPFSELIQNALDAIDEKRRDEPEHIGKIRIKIDLKINRLTVTDNGIGLNEDKFRKFLAPSFSFKSGKTRGHKGVGATYLAYGFNDIQIATRTPTYAACGRMQKARAWLSDENPAGNPKLATDTEEPFDVAFAESHDTGVSISIKFDAESRPSKLSWLRADKASQWKSILSIKTGLGCIPERPDLHAEIIVIDELGNITEEKWEGLSYAWPHTLLKKTRNLRDIINLQAKLFSRHGPQFNMPASMSNLDAIYFAVSANEAQDIIPLDESEIKFLKEHNAYIYGMYSYTAKIWQKINDNLSIRSGQSIFLPGIQIAANNMPQGEIITVPLKRNIGRQRQLHFVFHIEGVRPDLGRKGFQREIVEKIQSISDRIFRISFNKYTGLLKPVSGGGIDLARTQKVEDWKREFEEYERSCPLCLVNDHFFSAQTQSFYHFAPDTGARRYRPI